MQYLPLTVGDTGMAALVVLVTIQPTKVMHLSLFINTYLIDTGDAFAIPIKDG